MPNLIIRFGTCKVRRLNQVRSLPQIPLNQLEPPSKTPSSFNSKSPLTLVSLYIKRNLFSLCRLLVNVFIQGSARYSSLVNKELCEMICHLKYIFMWIFVIPQTTGNVFIWDFVQIFSFIRIGARSIHLVMYFI